MRVELQSQSLTLFLTSTNGTSLRNQNYKFDNPETIEKDLEVILEDVPMFIEVDISRKEQVLPMVPSWKEQ